MADNSSKDTGSASRRVPGWGIRLLLLLGAVGVFAGHAWIHERGQAPVFALLHNEDLARPLVEEHTDYTWDEWVSAGDVRETIDRYVEIEAWFYGACALCCLLLVVIPRGRHWSLCIVRGLSSAVIVLGAANLCVLSWAYHLDHDEMAFHYLEYAAQCVAPLVLVAVAGFHRSGWMVRMATVIALSAVFVIHGLYAIGYEREGDESMNYATPGPWMEMTVSGLAKVADLAGWEQPDEETAERVLHVAGILDFVAAGLVLLPYAGRVGLIYMMLWGLITAVARTWSNYVPEFAEETLLQWIPETLIRIPHFTLPLFLLVLSFRRRQTRSTPSHS